MVSVPSTKNNTISLRIRDRLVVKNHPMVMGIINTTPDSFYAASRFTDTGLAVKKAGEMLDAGADLIDLGGQSTRPGSARIDEATELERVLPVVKAIARAFPEALLSVDTWHSNVARQCLDAGASIINDITAGQGDAGMATLAASYRVPVILMHMQGTPATMQQQPAYTDVVDDVFRFLEQRIRYFTDAGVHDLVADPGFGFGKTLAHNLALARRFDEFTMTGVPLLAGISRKSMLRSLTGHDTAEVLPATAALHMFLLERGAGILRVHDVAEAVQCVKVFVALRNRQQ